MSNSHANNSPRQISEQVVAESMRRSFGKPTMSDKDFMELTQRWIDSLEVPQTPQDGHNLPTEDSTPPQGREEAQGSNPTSTERTQTPDEILLKFDKRLQANFANKAKTVTTLQQDQVDRASAHLEAKAAIEQYASTKAKAELEKLKAKIYMDVPTFETHNGKVWLEVDSTDKEFDEAIAALGEPPRGDSND